MLRDVEDLLDAVKGGKQNKRQSREEKTLEQLAQAFTGDDRFFEDLFNRLDRKSKYGVSPQDFAEAIAKEQPNRKEFDSRDLEDVIN